MREAAGSEREAIDAARAGDARALEDLMRAHRTRVIRYAMRVCISPEDAEDAAQETLLALSRSIGAFRGAAALSTWLFTVVRNHCTRLARRSLRAKLGLDDAEDPADPSAAADDALADEQLRALLARVMSTLSPGEREVLVRRDVLGQPASEVAAALGISVDAVKSRLHRARVTVRERLLAAMRRAPPGAARAASAAAGDRP